MQTIDGIMEEATAALLETRYLEAERLCLRALREARRAEAWDRYARILMPLQEARRQRRQIAVEHGVHALAAPPLSPAAILERYPAGCIMLIAPAYSSHDAEALREMARQRELYVEVLLLDAEAQRACFELQMERVGDHALASIARQLSPVERLDALAAVVERAGDHEIAHQRLAAAALDLARSA